jgi:hypothetical protein
MDKARILHMERIRQARKSEFTRLDAEWMRATGQKDASLADQIEAERQALRDMPQTVDLSKAKTPSALQKLWPKELPKQGTG